MDKFNKRTYSSFSEFLKDIKFLIKNHGQIKDLNRGELISKKMQERLMLAVTAVNGCRYCTYYHTKLALENGVTNQELDTLLNGSVDSSPSEEKLALLYAQHWADQAGKPDQEFKEKINETYGNQKAEVINLAIRTINFGNLMGNTFDYLLYKLSFGHLGAS